MDIRGFFGGGNSAKKVCRAVASALCHGVEIQSKCLQKAVSPAKPVNKRPIDPEDDLKDSDEDEDRQEASNR